MQNHDHFSPWEIPYIMYPTMLVTNMYPTANVFNTLNVIPLHIQSALDNWNRESKQFFYFPTFHL